MPSLSDDGRMSVSGVRPLLVGPYVLEFVCGDMKGLQVNANSSSCRRMAVQHVLRQLWGDMSCVEAVQRVIEVCQGK